MVRPALRRDVVAMRIIDRAGQKFSRVDEWCFSQPYRSAYGVVVKKQNEFAIGGCLYKHDVVATTRLVHDFGLG